MDVFFDIKDFPEDYKESVIAIGNFDGVHRGHQALLAKAKEIAAAQNKPFGILTFEPHPRSLFRPDDPPFRLTPTHLKQEKLSECGARFLMIGAFNWEFASQSAEDFIENILKNGLNPAHIVVGYDFHFGQLRKGTADTLREAGFEVTVIEKIQAGDHDLSSSDARSALRHGDIEKANEILGWDWFIEGEVVKGDQRGRKLGYPTANVHLKETMHPAYGVYASYVRILEDGDDSKWLPAATNIGIRPMFEVETGQVEAHILDFDRDIYGKTLRVRPVKRLRGEAKFETLESLIEQIEADCQETRDLLA